jgi:hypothetical protein
MIQHCPLCGETSAEDFDGARTFACGFRSTGIGKCKESTECRCSALMLADVT